MSSGSGLWQLLPWDTDFFRVVTGRIAMSTLEAGALDRALAECRAAGVEVVYYLAPADDDGAVLQAEEAGFHLVDIRVTLEWPVCPLDEERPGEGEIIRDHLGEDVPALQAIARSSHHHSRYYHDGRYPRERCDELYAEWIAGSCRGQAERVLVADRRGEPIAYVTCHLDSADGRGRIGLFGIQADARGRGVGGRLLRAAQRWFGERGARRVSVATQARNVVAQRLYQRHGFATSDVALWYHKWLGS